MTHDEALPPQLRAAHLQPPGADPSALAECERRCGVEFPPDYRAFLQRSNGYDGFVGAGERYLALWAIEAYSPGNSGYERVTGMEDVFYVGHNGGPTAFAIDRAGPRPRWVSVPWVPGTRDEVRVLGGSFAEFIAAIAAGEGW